MSAEITALAVGAEWQGLTVASRVEHPADDDALPFTVPTAARIMLTSDGGPVHLQAASACLCPTITATVAYQVWTPTGRTRHGSACHHCRRTTD